MDSLEGRLGTLLRKKGLTLSVAESCTGGLLSKRITDIPGASDYFLLGAVVYSNSAKINVLDVREETIQNYGAVSRECASEMALGVMEKSGSDIAVAITGIAGPSGGTATKPVGLVWFALMIRGAAEARCESRVFSGSRTEIREKSATHALEMLYSGAKGY